MATLNPQPGMTLAGKYRLISELGRGGMGSVWRAEHTGLHSEVAIKLIHHSAVNNPAAVDRFVQEARAAAALRSPHVVQVFDVGLEGELPYIAMELLEGESPCPAPQNTRTLAAE